uniref:Rad21/Rec8-like protein N-terminal domain-containing protein n=1 Tax=Tetradesmus obliquus TaxID=3088 RepID=A0A383WID4_TETOB|eukprot:jgi/Sobl393_1/13163/SZX69852.1
MFYSHDLLGRKTPLGAIWKLAHGSKLSKGKIISINLREICQEILQPGVPHSLRLDAILIGGLVIVFNKQQAYLLEDLQEMMRKVKAAGKGTGGGGDGAGTMKSAGDKNTLKKARNQAKLEAITMLDMEDLLAPMGDDPLLMALAGGHDDDLALLRPGSSGMNFSLHGSGSHGTTSDGSGRLAKRRRGAQQNGNEVADGLFLMPSLPTASDAVGTGAAAGRDQDDEEVAQPAAGRSRSRGVSWATGDTEQGSRGRQQGAGEQEAEEGYGGLAHAAGAWPHQDEMFDVNFDLDQFDLLGDMNAAPAADGPAKSKSTTTTEQQARSAATTPASSELAGAVQQQDPTLLAADADPFALADTEFDQAVDQQVFDQDFDQPLGEMGRGLQGTAPAAPEQHLEEEEEEAAAGARAAMRKSKKRKASALIIDDLDNLQIRSKVYRDWVNDTGDLINHNLLKGTARATSLLANPAAAAGITGAAAASLSALAASGPLSGLSGPSLGLSRAVRTSLGLSGPSGLSSLEPAALFADPMPLYARLGLGAGVGGVGLCCELQELFRAPVEAAAAAAEQRKAAKRGRGPSSPEVNNSTGDMGGLHGALHGQLHRNQLHLMRTHPGGFAASSQDDEDEAQQGLMMMPEIEELEQQQQQHEALSNDEAHDQLMELPYGDVEVERLRDAGAPTSPASGSLRMTSPHGAPGTGERRAESGTSGSSMLQQDLQYEGPEIDSVAGGGLRRKLRLQSGDLGGPSDGMYFGAGRLDDLLPDVPLPEEEYEQPDETQDEEAAAHGSKGFGSHSGGFGSGLNSIPSSQWPLLEETEGHEATQLVLQQQGQAAGMMTAASRKVLSIFRDRLQPGAETQEDGAQPSLSLFGLMKEGQLSRSAAAMLFYQVCVTSSAGYISASQDRPFGDITIQPGKVAL